MINKFTFFDLLISLGIIQGVITSILLLKSKNNAYSNKFLAIAVFSFSLLCVKTLIHLLGLWEVPVLRYFPISVELLIGPLLYFYVESLISPKFSFDRKKWLHFSFFIIAQAYSSLVYYSTLKTDNLNVKDSIAGSLFFGPVKTYEEYFGLISVVAYLIISYSVLKKYKKWLHNNISDNTYPSFRWLSNIFKLSVILALFMLTNILLDIFLKLNETNMFHWDALIVYIAFLIYYFGLSGYLQPDYKFIKKRKTVKKPNTQEIPEKKKAKILKDLKKTMNIDKAFLSPILNVDKLANMLNITSRDLSKIINEEYKKSFRDFINEYRIEEVKNQLKSSVYKHKSILGIATECGFNSEASFYRIFKKVTNKSPKEFINDNNAINY